MSSLIEKFLENTEENSVTAVVARQRNCEVGIVVPAKYSAFTKDLKTATILYQEILKKKSKYSHFQLVFSVQKLLKAPILRKE